jgi:hypothetical protein
MDYAQQQRQPGKHATGITVVIILHVVVGYALVSGLARKAIEVIKQPMTTKVIEEQKSRRRPIRRRRRRRSWCRLFRPLSRRPRCKFRRPSCRQ